MMLENIESFEMWVRDIGSKKLVIKMFTKKYRNKMNGTSNPIRKLYWLLKIKKMKLKNNPKKEMISINITKLK